MTVEHGVSSNGASTEDAIAGAGAGAGASSLDGLATPPQDPFGARPELLLGVALLGGLVFGGLVSRLGR